MICNIGCLTLLNTCRSMNSELLRFSACSVSEAQRAVFRRKLRSILEHHEVIEAL